MAHTDPRVDAYIAKSREFARPVLAHLRALVHAAVPEAEETLKWSMPSFVLGGQIVCMMAAFKEHCTFGFWHPEMKKLAGGDRSAMGSFGRITALADLPGDAKMKALLKKAAALAATGEPARRRPASPAKAKKPVAVPPDLAAALKRNKAAARTFEAFSPSCRREYVEWITEARREETRAKRLATALEWMAEGKKRNWKYEAC